MTLQWTIQRDLRVLPINSMNCASFPFWNSSSKPSQVLDLLTMNATTREDTNPLKNINRPALKMGS